MRWSWIVLASLSLFVLGLADNVRGPLFPEVLSHFSLADARGSWMFATSSICAAFGAVLCSRLRRSMGRVAVLELASLIMAAGLLFMGLAPAFTFFLMGSALLGLSMGLLGVIQNVLVSEGSSDLRRPQILAGLHSMYGLASFFAPVTVTIAIGFFGAWQSPFLVVAATAAAVAVISQIRRRRLGETEAVSHVEVKSGQMDWIRPSWLAIAMSLYVATEIMVSSRLALYLRRTEGLDLASSGWWVAAFFAGLLGGRLVNAFWRWPWKLKYYLMLSLAGAIVSIALGLQGWRPAWILCGLAMSPFYPVFVTELSQRFPGDMDRTMGLMIGLQSVSIVLMHLAIGELTDLIGIEMALWTGPAALAIGLVMLGTYDHVFHRHAHRI